MLAGTAVALACAALAGAGYLSLMVDLLGVPGGNVFCGDAAGPGYSECAAQMGLFAIASLIPAMLALILMVAAFATPVIRRNTGLRARTLGYALVAWAIAGFTYVLGGLPPL